MCFITLSGIRFNVDSIAEYKDRSKEFVSYGNEPQKDSRILLKSGYERIVSETVEEIDAMLQECYITVKSIK